jgi:hypothetical protein
LALTVGSWGVGIMNSMAFSLLANSSSEIDENQKMELTIGSLSFCVGLSGTIRLSGQFAFFREDRKNTPSSRHWIPP